jgi:hypothetical protein
MRKFTKILESTEDSGYRHIKACSLELSDMGMDVEIERQPSGNYKFSASFNEYTGELFPLFEEINNFITKLQSEDMQVSRLESLRLQKGNAYVSMLIKIPDGNLSEDSIKDWKSFEEYCKEVLNVDGIEGTDSNYFRINVVDKKNGWPGLPDDMAGWSIEVDEDERDIFVAAFPGYEDFLKKLLSRQINYNLVWHLCSDEGDRHHRISDPVKLAESNKNHNPMKFDKEGIEAVETLLEMAQKFPDKIEIKKHNI